MTAPAIPVSDVQAERNFIDTITERFEKEDAGTPIIEAPKDPVPAPAAVPTPIATEPAADVTATPDATPTEPDVEKDDDDDQGTPPDITPEPDTDDDLDEEFKEAAKLHKVALTVDDLPEEARPLVKKRIKELEAMATRATMDARSYRADEAKFKAEERFRLENPAEYVADLLLTNPDLGEKVNALLDNITSDMQKQAHAIVVKDKRAKALTATEAEQQAHAARAERGLALDSYTRTQALKLGVPMELGVETAVIAHIQQHGDIGEKDIDQIVAQKAKEYENHTRAIRREASKKYVAGKVDAIKNGGLKVKPGSGNTPAPSGKAKPKNDEEFTNTFVANMK